MGAVGATAVAGAVWQAVATARDRRRVDPPGRLVDVGGHRLSVVRTGAENPLPTVVLEAGANVTGASWGHVQSAVAEFAPVVSYDRAGLGWSEASDRPRHAHEVVDQLHTALAGVDAEGPYVLVGHSLGCEFVRVFADRYPEETEGVVLVDPGVLDESGVLRVGVAAPSLEGVRAPAETVRLLRWATRLSRLAPLVARLGVFRAALRLGAVVGAFPDADAAAVTASMATTRHWEAAVTELAAIDDIAQQTRATGSLGEKPLVVLNSDSPESEMTDAIRAFGTDLAATLSSAGAHRIVEGATHVSLLSDPDHATETVEAIREVVETVRRRHDHGDG